MKPDSVPASIRYVCNICKQANELPAVKFHRELGQCTRCGSTPRFRGLMYALSLALFDKNMALPDFPARKDLRGVGISDWGEHAARQQPRLFDLLGRAEHVLPPVLNPLHGYVIVARSGK